ncbi:hypothetical protein ACF2JD_11385 [Aeromonas sp. A-5]|uniref:hypothetical protein n=1 Tax=Aeromonas ichthyocola TaxID=3367746 RepID=UPI0038DCD7CF
MPRSLWRCHGQPGAAGFPLLAQAKHPLASSQPPAELVEFALVTDGALMDKQ